MVSIPIGFSSSLQHDGRIAVGHGDGGFNPYRVFKFVATSRTPLARTRSDKFQSLSGFQVRCNGITLWCVNDVVMVTIPIGFSSSVQLNGVYDNVEYTSKFQSLSGFQVRCNLGCCW